MEQKKSETARVSFYSAIFYYAQMDTVTATLRVRAEGADTRPTRERLEHAAQCLRVRGFDVLHVGRFGVMVRALPEAFQSEFHVHVRPNERFVASVKASTPRLHELVDSLEVAPPAQPFSGSAANG